MKTFSGRPFSSSMTRRVLSIAATAAAIFVTNNALADEAPAATNAAESVEQPKSDTSVEASAPTTVEPAPAPAAETVTPAPAVEAPATVEAPALVVAPAPVFEAPRFAPMTMAPAQQDRPLEAPHASSKKDESFRVGAMVGVGFPRPFAAEGFVKIKKIVGVGFEYSFMPNANVMGTEISFHGVAADLRVFPLKGGLFVGVRGGKQWLSTRTTITASVNGVPGVGGTYVESMNAETMFVNPRIGYLKTFDNGITLGFDAGVQIPVNPSYTRESDAARSGIKAGEADKAYASVANTLGNKTIPTIDLLRVGFLF